MIAIATGATTQADRLREINAAIGQMDKATKENAEMVDETMSAAHHLRRDTERLAALVGTFKIGDEALRAMPPGEAGAQSLRVVAQDLRLVAWAGTASDMVAAPALGPLVWRDRTPGARLPRKPRCI